METSTDTLEAQLLGADDSFERAPLPLVYAGYLTFMETGRYPYTDDVAWGIAETHGIAILRHHTWLNRPGCDPRVADLTVRLHHEVYLASGQYNIAKMVTQEAMLSAGGYRPITELAPREGLRIQLAGDCHLTVYRLKPAGNGDWALLAPGKRTNGVSLDGLVRQHRAYEKAKADGYESMNNPVVRMYAEVGR